MAALTPIPRLLVCGAAAGLLIVAATGADAARDVLLGVSGPVVAACGTWIWIARVYRTAPDRSMQAMLALFMAKILLFGIYTIALLEAGVVEPLPFVASFVASFVMLHVMQAMQLRRLFASRF
jgi:hypothetical protein